MPRSLWIVLAILLAFPNPQTPTSRWTGAKANEWYQHQPWLVGSNFIPATAINELEMWQADTFDPKEIDKELGWAEGLGMNTMRVFLDDLVWQAQTLNDLGNAHMGQDDLGRALPYYLESLKRREDLGDIVGVGCSLNVNIKDDQVI